MKRFHVHVSVNNLEESIRFYSTVFAAQPAVRQQDYAKWMLDDPRINFAISTQRQPVGINHVGFQVETDEELRSMHAQLKAADTRLVQEDEQPCCYASSETKRRASFSRGRPLHSGGPIGSGRISHSGANDQRLNTRWSADQSSSSSSWCLRYHP